MDPRPAISPNEQEIKKTTLEERIDCMTILVDSKIIDKDFDVPESIQQNLSLHSQDLLYSHRVLTKEAAVVLAYLDLQVEEAKRSGVSSDDITSIVPRGIIAALATNQYLRNEASFTDAVFLKAKELTAGGGVLSSILFEAVKVCQSEMEHKTTLVIDESTGAISTPVDKRDDEDTLY